MKLEIRRCPENPIVTPGKYAWRMSNSFNPAVIYENNKFYMYERAAGGLRPFYNYLGMLESDDGIQFKHSSDQPVLTPEMIGSKYGSVQDPRIVKIEEKYYITFAYRPYAWNSNPTGLGIPKSTQAEYPGFDGDESKNQTRSGIVVSNDLRNWKFHSWVNSMDLDDRNVILFPEKIHGKYAVLRRPSGFVTTNAQHETHPAIQISYSEDLSDWSEPEVVIKPELEWENNRIGGSTPPIKTEYGWLVLYHGVETQDISVRRVCYRMSAMMLDINDPTKVIARCPKYIMEPEAYYEKIGLYIPNVIFPTASPVVNGIVHIYYGCCDTSIGLATVSLNDLTEYVMQYEN